jgi:hypothetical protein
MTVTVRLRRHEAVPQCGSFEVYYSDGLQSVFFYWDDVASRRLRPELTDRPTALAAACFGAPIPRRAP